MGANVVLIPGTTPGHAGPFFDLAIRIAPSGSVKVTILAVEYQVPKLWRDAIYGRWTPRLQAGHPTIEVVAVKDGLYCGSLEVFRTVCVQEFSEAKFIAAFSASLAPIMATPCPPCCIISGMLHPWTKGLAANFNIPRYLMHIQPASSLSLMLHVPDLIAQGRLPLTEDNTAEAIEIPGLGFPLQPADLPTDLHDPESLKWGSQEFFFRMARKAREAPIVLVNTFQELEGGVLAELDKLHSQAADGQVYPKVIPIGPLLLPPDFPSPVGTVIGNDESEETANLMQWLDTQPPRSVLYIAFGTLVENAKAQMEEIAHGLEDSRSAPEREAELSHLWCQLRVLRHPACGAFLNHCGWNTVVESLAGGVPLIAWPRFFEQRMTARYLVDIAKVATEVVDASTGVVTRDEIERVVRLMMQQPAGEALRSRAAELKQLMAARYAHSIPNLDTLLAELITQSSSE